MNLRNIASSRLASQQVSGTDFDSAGDLVSWMGAMQAQDYPMAKWAIGIRLKEATNKTIEEAIAKGDIIRTHVLRPTWHFVSPKDIYWMLQLTAPHIKASMRSRHKELGLDEKILARSNRIIEKSLSRGNHLTRTELVSTLPKGKADTTAERVTHMLLTAELDGIICSGATRGKKITYGLLAERVPTRSVLSRDEALAMLAARYFSSHGPATIQDFAWWSGLPAGDARRALDMVKENFVSETIGTQTFWLSDSFATINRPSPSVYLLPAFDEYVISYKDRSACLPLQHYDQTISINGIFRAPVVINGQVLGTWKRTLKKNKTLVETEFFVAGTGVTSKAMTKRIKGAAAKVQAFFD
jgi:hypothetical protein